MSVFIKLANRLSLFGAWLSAFLLIYSVCHVLVDIVLRVGFGTSTHTMDEMVGYAVGAMTFMALAYSESQRSLIRVNVLHGFLSRKSGHVLDLVCLLLTLGSTAFLFFFMGRVTLRDFERGRVSIGMAEIPLWIPQSILLVGLAIFMVQLVASMVGLCIRLSDLTEEA